MSVDKLWDLVKLAHFAERYFDMCKYTRQLIITKTLEKTELDYEERNMVSLAYKKVISNLRFSLNKVKSSNNDKIKNSLKKKYKKQLQNEITNYCNEIISLLQNNIIPLYKNNENNENFIFYCKMTGDYFRYLCQIKKSNENEKNKCLEYYKKAFNLAENNLKADNETRLKLCLNFSVFYFDILNEQEKAIKLAKETFDNALNAIMKDDPFSGHYYKDNTPLLQIIRDNITKWTSN